MTRIRNLRFFMLSLLVLFASGIVYSQISAGGRFGPNLANLSVKNNSMLIGYNIGGFVNMGMKDAMSGDIADILSFQAELSVQTKGAKGDYYFIVPGDPTETIDTLKNVEQKFTYVVIPILAKFTFPTGRRSDWSVFAEAGPYLGALFGVTIDGKKTRDDDGEKSTDPRKFREEYAGYSYGITAGTGLMYKLPFGGRKQPFSAFLNLRYSLGLANIGEYKEKTIDIPPSALENIKTNTIAILLGVAYRLQ